jgi:hypothetical protein
MHEYAWIISEPVNVTPLKPQTETAELLVASTLNVGVAAVVTFDVGRILINGQYADLGDDMMAFCGLADEAYYVVKVGDTYLSEPFDRDDPIA